MTSTSEANNSIRFCIRSYIAFVLAPQAPIIEWLAQLDNWVKNSPGFFAGRPVVLDLSTVKLGQVGIRHLLGQLVERNIRIIGLEGADASQLDPSLPPLLTGGRPSERQAADARTRAPRPTAAQKPAAAADGRTDLAADRNADPLRPDGLFPERRRHGARLGRVRAPRSSPAARSTSTARCAAAPWRASTGDGRARIFCRRNEAELLAIDGYYRTAEDMGSTPSAPRRSSPGLKTVC